MRFSFFLSVVTVWVAAFLQTCNVDAEAASGEPSVLYHGTDFSKAVEIFRDRKFRASARGYLGPGLYLADSIEKASAYGDVILRVEVDLGRVEQVYTSLSKRYNAKRDTYDTAKFDPEVYHEKTGQLPFTPRHRGKWHTEYCVRKPQERVRRFGVHRDPSTEEYLAALTENERARLEQAETEYDLWWQENSKKTSTKLFSMLKKIGSQSSGGKQDMWKRGMAALKKLPALAASLKNGMIQAVSNRNDSNSIKNNG